MLKEPRRLSLLARETPLSEIYPRNMLEVSHAGAAIFPPVLTCYIRAPSGGELVEQSVGRMLDLFDLDTRNFER